MGAARKLQSEIDRCLKKVQEGIDEFDQIWQKVHDTDNANQKEKYEADLKKEIKKLQRLRDQIKSWISGADIKDKTTLLDARKSIEREMERFKTCEKEAKMKQFSKMALGQADKLDPREQAKQETREWINEIVDKLTVRIEQFEYEMEEMQANLKKKAKPPPKLVQLEEVVTVHKKHVQALEKALRCLDNDALTSEELDPLKDDLEYYMGLELDEHYDNTDDMYCDIADRLEAVEAAAPAANLAGHLGSLSIKKDGKMKSGGGKDDEEREKERERERERAAAAAVKAQLIAQGNSNVKPLEEPDDRTKPGTNITRPPALSTAGSGALSSMMMPPASPLSTPAGGGVGGALVPPSPKLVPVPTPRGGGPQPLLQQQKGDDGPLSPVQARNAAAAAAAAAGEQPGVDSHATNGPAAAAAGPTPQPLAAAAGTAGRPTLAALIGGAAAREQQAAQQAQQQAAQQQQQQQQQQPPAQPPAAVQQQQQVPPQQQQQQQAKAAAAGQAADAAASAAAPTPAGGRLGAWMSGGPEGNKGAAPSPGAAGAAMQQQQQQSPQAAQQQQQPAAAALLGKGLAAAGKPAGPQQQQAAAAGGAAAGAGAKGAAGQQQPGDSAAAASNGPMAPPAAAATGAIAPSEAAAADPAVAAAAAAAAAAAGVPLLPEGASGGELLEGWCGLAASELGLGSSMLGQVPRGIAALPVLEAVMRSALPQPSDSDWDKPKPRHPIVGPASYPKSQPDVISAPGLFRKMDPEALFFAFYYQPDTYQQYLAAQELKRQSWRYHKQHNAWFQRYAEPTVTTDEFEQGTYVYFDFNIMHDDLQTGWCYRRKENFTFRYDALEDELPVSQV